MQREDSVVNATAKKREEGPTYPTYLLAAMKLEVVGNAYERSAV